MPCTRVSLGASALLLLLGAVPDPGARAAPARPRGLAFPPVDPEPQKPWGAPLASNERRITILGTNDIHGAIDSVMARRGPVTGHRQGGLAFFSGVVKAVRQGVAARDGQQGGVLLVDAGDQFQGTLLSNTNEGRAIFEAMAVIGYDAIVPGNHDYDFGPLGWKVDEAQKDEQRREALSAAQRSLTARAIPFLSANTFLRSSISYVGGPAEPALGVLCQPGAVGRGEAPGPLREIDFARARRPDFLQDAVVKTVAGVRVALIGLDHPSTPTTTTARNVDDLCFAPEVGAYRAAVERLKAAAPDLYVIVAHDGNTGPKGRDVEKVVQGVRAAGLPLHAVVSGHTHKAYAEVIDGVPVIQSGSNGGAFGRIDLIWDSAARRLVPEKTKLAGGVPLQHDGCSRIFAKGFCTEQGGAPRYEGQPVVLDPAVQKIVDDARAQLSREEALHQTRLGALDGELFPHRTDESTLANAVTDAYRAAANVDVVMVNTGGLRAPIFPRKEAGGTFFYFEDLFNVLPFGNHGVRVRADWATLEDLLLRSAKTCGKYGALMQSGLEIEYRRDCRRAKDDLDAQATLVRVRKIEKDGKRTVLFDAAKGVRPPAEARFSVATFDFLAKGGSGYTAFARSTPVDDLGILRDYLASQLSQQGGKARWVARLDGRWKNLEHAERPGGDGPAPDAPASTEP